jgi:hypothetical protein
VVGDLVGEGASQEQAVVGETPNLAARLRASAEPGSVVIAPATRRLLGDRFRLQALGRHEVKGLTEPVETWTVEGVSASEGRFDAVRSGRLTGFVGREMAWGETRWRWHIAHGERVPGHLCAGCRRPIGDAEALHIIDGYRVHRTAGRDCLIRHGERWRGEATAGLRALGLDPPPDEDQVP